MLDGPSECAGGIETMQRLRQRARAERIPLSVSLSLTHRCNLVCEHCYARTSADLGRELSTAQWCGLIDALAEAGCLFVVLTGGEPLVRADFADLYRHARGRGLIVTVFTNASRLDESHIALWKESPPREVDITLYGMSEATYRRVTGQSGLFERIWRNIDRLLANGIRVGLKAMILSHTREEIPAMEEAARQRGVGFRLDGAVFSRYDGDRTPLELRLPADAVAEIELSDSRRAAQWKAFLERHGSIPGNRKALYRCSAGVTHAHIDPSGLLCPCLMVSWHGVSLVDHSFDEAWRTIGARLSGLTLPDNSPCINCEKHVVCGYCPGFSRLETGAEDAACNYQCELGDARLRRIRQMTPELE